MPKKVDCFKVEVRYERERLVVAVTGEVDLATTPFLTERLTELAERGPVTVVLDTRGVAFMDSAGVAALIKAHHALVACGGALHLGPMSDAVTKILGLSGVLDKLPRSRNLKPAG
ncbi:MAG: STAS domain-containing protein [Acidimicrobiales bacterium]